MPNPSILLLWLLTLLLAAIGGWSLHSDHQAAQKLDQVEQAQKKTTATQDVVDGQAEVNAAQAAKQEQKDHVIIKEVIRYEKVTQPAQRCNLPGTWRVRHDAAATGNLPESPRLADAEAAPVTDAAALDIVADNYTNCRATAKQVTGWQEFWGSVKESCRGAQ